MLLADSKQSHLVFHLSAALELSVLLHDLQLSFVCGNLCTAWKMNALSVYIYIYILILNPEQAMTNPEGS